MALKDRIKSFLSGIREKHKLTFMDDSSYHEKWSFRVSTLNLFSLLGLYSIVLVIVVILLFRFTGLRRLVSSGNSYENELIIESNNERIDSLSKQLDDTELYMQELQLILNGGPIGDSLLKDSTTVATDYVPDFSKSPADSILRAKYESEMRQITGAGQTESFTFFFPPVKGIVSQSFESNQHRAVDVVTEAEAPIKACLEGTIIFDGWAQSEGHIVVIQHQDNMISVYKHCSAVLKSKGAKVQAGDPIAIVGNSGENTNGPHLHFELWKSGISLDPESYILFE
ncbi:MAG: M23 family metallopeptidase [Crocinitomicaceae bacterium]